MSVSELKVTFSSDTETEAGYDYIYIYDKDNNQIGDRYEGTNLANKTITVPGNIVKIKLTSDGSMTKYGYKIINITNKNKIDLSYGKEILLRYSCAQHSNEIIKWLLKKSIKLLAKLQVHLYL